MCRAPLVSVVCAVLAVSSAKSHAANVTVEPIGIDEGNVTALLERTSQYYIDAMRSLIGDRYKDEYRALRWEALETAMNRATVARLEYRFMLDGEPTVRVYHAMSGQPLSSIASSIFEGETPPGTPTSPGSPIDASDVDLMAAASEPIDYAVTDAQDAAYFTGFEDTDVRAAVLASEDSVLGAFYVDGANTSLDAEFKALRAIESDMKHGIVPRGGSIRGAIGGATCGSCRYAMRSVSDTYGIDIRISQMFGSLPRAQQNALLASGRARLKGPLLMDATTNGPLLARDVLSRARETQVRQSLSPRAMGRSFKGMPWRQRSFRLGPPRLPRVSEGAGDDPGLPNPDVNEAPQRRC